MAAVGVVSYRFLGDSVYAPIGFGFEWCFLCVALRSVRSRPTRIALSFPVLASVPISKMTFVPTGGIMLRPSCRGSGKPVQPLGKTKMASSVTVSIQPYLPSSIIDFMTPFLDNPSGLAFSRADFVFFTRVKGL